MSKYFLITESALDYCLLNDGFSEGFLPKETSSLRAFKLSDEVVGYRISNEPERPYFALVKTECIVELGSISGSSADDIFAALLECKGLKSPLIIFPRQWSEYHHKNLLAFFALRKESLLGVGWLIWTAPLTSFVLMC